MRVLSAGDGYRYLLKTVAAGDGDRDLATSLTRYYAEKGTPPGFWLGAGVLGLGAGSLMVGDEVTEKHLRRLLGQGLDPVTGEPLGAPYYKFKSVRERMAGRVAQLGADLSVEERTSAVAQIEAEEQARGARRTVAGFDFTFSVPKSVSTLWAVADAGTQSLIAQGHHAAIRDVLALMERDVVMTRTGHNGVAQVETRGLIATAYDHYDSRSSDPQLHTHVVVANKVQGIDGKWRSVDGRPMHAAVVAMSEHYNTILADHLTRSLGVGWEKRDRGRDRNPAWEITGVPDQLIGEFSSRSSDIEVEKNRLIAEYVERRGRQPSTKTIIRLRQQATLATRPDKVVKSLAELTADWRSRASTVLGADATTWASHLLAKVDRPAVLRADDTLDVIGQVAREVIEVVGTKRSTWRRWNLHAEASRQTMGLRFASTTDRDAVIGMIVDAAQTHSLQLSPPDLVTTPAVFQRADGSSVFRPKHHTVFSASVILEAEDRLLAHGHATDAPTLKTELAVRIARRRNSRGVVLSSDQQLVVEQIATSGRTLDVLVGPAGTGKTTTLGALRRAWEKAHGHASVVGLAPSAAAADVLAGDLGISTENTTKWLHEHARGRWNLSAGQLVIVDEASLAGTLALDTLTTHAATVGAKVLLVGDFAQLTAIDAGGAFGLLVRDRGQAPELIDVRRFTHDWERAASLRLRLGHTDAIDTYLRQGRIAGGTQEDILNQAYASWKSDIAAGMNSVLIAQTHDTVTELNTRARDDRILAGQVSPEGVRLHDGNLAGKGDLIITRSNDRRLVAGHNWVKNGDRWRVTHHHKDGSLTVARTGGRSRARLVLPAAYVAEHVDLGYAITTHRAQGATVDTAHALVHASSMTRESFYVAMTRGRHSNIAYVVTDEAHLETHQQDDDNMTARTVLYGVLQHEGRELSAHETITAEHDTWSGIGHLADQYESIAQQAQGEHFAALVVASGLNPAQAETVIESETFGALVADLRQVEASGHDAAGVLARAVAAGNLFSAQNLTPVIRGRVQKLMTTRSGGTRQRGPRRYIVGLIPEATGDIPDDMRQALNEIKDLIEQRATAIARAAIDSGESWTQALGVPPRDPRKQASWFTNARIIAAYRDRHGIDSHDTLGRGPDSATYRLDRSRAATALSSARALDSQTPTMKTSSAAVGITDIER